MRPFFYLLFFFFFQNNVYTQCWKQLESGGNHTVGIHEDGTLWAWGSNSGGEIGDGTTNNKNVPVLISPDTRWISISAGDSHTLALKSDGTLWSWGYNVYGALGLGDVTQVNFPTQIGNGRDWAFISAGDALSFAIKSDGTLWGWGMNLHGEIGDGSITPKLIPTRVGSASNWKKVVAGDGFTAAIKNNGTLWTWGSYNNWGELGNGSYSSHFIPTQIGTDTNWSSVSCGMTFGLGIKTDGTLWGWGNNTFGQLGLGNVATFLFPTQIGTESNWKSAEGGNFRSYFIKNNGTLWGTGNGPLGNGNTNNSNPLVQVGTDTDWSTVSTHLFHAIALKTNKIGYGWGYNYFGQIGNGYTDNGLNNDPNDYNSPVRIICPCTTTISPVFTLPQAICSGAMSPILPTTSDNGISGIWTPSVILNTANGIYVFTPNAAIFPCANNFSFSITVVPSETPMFAPIPLQLCQYDTAPVLPSNSINTIPIAGVWNPATINTAVTGQTTYTFVPNPEQCVSAVPYQLTIEVLPSIRSDFNTIDPICKGSVSPLLSNVAPNGVTGTWSPSVINNASSGNYEFTPNGSGCIAKQILHVTVLPQTIPDFSDLSLCKGDTSTILQTISPNGISGNWTPPVIDYTTDASYVFIPAVSECATNKTIAVRFHESLLESVTYEITDAFNDHAVLTINALPIGNYSYQLDGGISQTSPVFQDLSPGQHSVVVSDIEGCNTILKIEGIQIIDYSKFFTPNGDGYNDYWNIIGMDRTSKAEVYIFDRYGKLLKQIDVSGSGWDGTYNGQMMPSTDYWFRVDYIENNVLKQFKSHFTLKR